MTDFLWALNETLTNYRPLVEMWIGRLVLVSAGLFVVYRIGVALYHLIGMTCFGLLCRKYMTEKKGD